MKVYCRKSCDYCGEKSSVKKSDLCSDKNEQCAYWASKGECKANPSFMYNNCAKSCNTCSQKKTATVSGGNSELTRPQQLILDWSESVGVRQTAIGSEAVATFERIKQSKAYWEQEATEALPADLLAKCRNQHELCSFWALLGK